VVTAALLNPLSGVLHGSGRGRGERLGDVAMLIAGPLLVLSTFLVWSYQFSAVALARYGSSLALQGVPHDPDAWQVYSTVDVLLVLIAIALVAVALAGGRAGRWVLLAVLAVALAFCIHAAVVVPTNGSLIGDTATGGYVDTGASSGAGEIVALAALSLGAAGVIATLLTEL
jgi:hypothetical protein